MLWDPFLYCINDSIQGNSETGNKVFVLPSKVAINSIVETAKANNLKPFDYVQHLLEEIPKHMNDKDCSFLEELLPWSEKLLEGSAKLKYRWLQSSRLKM